MFCLFCLLGTLVISTSLQAQKVVALHSGADILLFDGADGFQQAYAAAANGDVIYLPGATYAPPALIEKQITVFGTGHYSTADSPTGRTVINGHLNLSAGADHVHLEGLHVLGGLSVGNDISVNYLTIKRCRLSGAITFSGTSDSNFSNHITISESVIGGRIFLRNARTVGVYNSVLENSVDYSQGNTFQNNLFFHTSYVIGYSHNNDFVANVFRVGTNAFLTNSSTGNYFNYNVIAALSPSYGDGAQVIGNYPGVAFSGAFVSQVASGFSYDDDYHLASPESYVDGDGVQVGLYGGMFPYKDAAVPVLPQIISKQIAPKSGAGGTLQIDIQVEAQQE
ncbi:hypothetical protein JCM15548_13884 [Geofilum rubicundum JCM 15548]|uniref:Periplasmic copper-binding protein NosD beta helix domain-containing protein n=2 Tax=Geofilum TaxID=1236988 RepID=A0A0E9M137_9BACT|nr:hypothetical protein JCM15548_13884 [Geofilum rubicundum JCM 15548]